MNRIAIGALLACAASGCATSQPTIVTPVAERAVASPAARTADRAAEPKLAAAVVATRAAPKTVAVEPAVRQVPGTWISAAAGSDFVLAGGQDQFAAVWVDVPKVKRLVHVPVMIALTIDTSGSMSGSKIVHARRAAVAMVNKLHDGDMISISAFSGTASELLAPTVITPTSRAHAVEVIKRLEADGSTNMFEALKLATSRAVKAPTSHPVRRVVMISDGKATAGVTDTLTLSDVSALGMRHGTQTTALGVGLDYDEKTLNQLAVRSSGRLFHLNDEKEMVGIVGEELKLLQSTVATKAFIEVLPAPGVKLVGISGVRHTRTASGGIRVPLGSVFAGQRRELVVRYRLTGGPREGTRALASTRLLFEDPRDGGLQRVQEAIVRAKVTTDATMVAKHENGQAQAIIAMLEASTLAATARDQVASGDFDKADDRLAMAEKKLRQRARQAKHKADKQRMVLAAKRLARSRRAVKAVRAAPPKARPRAARKSSLELNDASMDMLGF